MIIGENIILRPVEQGDFWHLWQWNLQERFFLFNSFARNMSHEELLQRFERKCAASTVFIIEKINGELIGICAYKTINWRSRLCEINLKMHPEMQSSSLGREAVEKLLSYLKLELNLRKVQILLPENYQAENSIFEQSGFKKEGVFRQRFLHGGKRLDMLVLGYQLQEAGSEQRAYLT